MTEAKSEAERRQSEADPFIIGLIQHALETADVERLADLIEGFLTSDDQAMRDAFIMGLARSQSELTPEEHSAALKRVRDQLDNRPPGKVTGTASRPTHYESLAERPPVSLPRLITSTDVRRRPWATGP